MKIIKKKGFNRNHLAKSFAKLGYTKGVEIGVRNGRYSEVLCKQNKALFLRSVDPYSVVYGDHRTTLTGESKQKANLRRATKKLAPYNCEVIVRTSLEAVLNVPYESIDFVYIDGSHKFDYVMCDIIEWGKRIKKGGITSGHDYYRFKHPDVVDAVNIYCKIHKVKKLYITDEKSPSWWFKKTW